ncbi:SA1362 family protein [Virgibacillus ndiopensis]|uniref:SA1362 family protein n=1 Tax=Virgibacillus ndiopensis TaxID=2004408 RepID=UPI000C077F2F|nr:SA1362 family protein [Virgibacillus ndiopensis]
MLRNKLSLIMYLIIGLAVVGLLSQVFTNTINFITNIFIMIGIGLAFFALIYFVFLRKRAPSSDMKKYKKAVKQSKSKYGHDNKPNFTNSKRPQQVQMKKKLNKRASHLRVIDGNKHKRKNRATF